MAVVFDHPKSLLDVSTHFCPGCGHGIVHRLVCEVIDEMGIEGDTIGVVPVGCSVMSYNYFGCDVIEAPHGRAPAVATGAKRVNPDKFVFSYQGDGDLAAIGTAETVHVGTRGEKHRGHLYQQHDLRHDRRSDGAHHPAGTGDTDHAVRQKRRDCRLSHPHLRDDGDSQRYGAGTACCHRQRAAHP